MSEELLKEYEGPNTQRPKKTKPRRERLEVPPIRLPNGLSRYGIIKFLVDRFINEESKKEDRKRIQFAYPVETLTNGKNMFILRPGKKWGFDFRVEPPNGSQLGRGKQNEIALVIRRISRDDPQISVKLWRVLLQLYRCETNDVDSLLQPLEPELPYVNVEALIKVTRWMFIMEDIHYWFFEGRAFLYNFYRYAASEVSDERLAESMEQITAQPSRLLKGMKAISLDWESPE